MARAATNTCFRAPTPSARACSPGRKASRTPPLWSRFGPEDGILATQHPGGSDTLFDIAGGVQFVGQLGIGAGDRVRKRQLHCSPASSVSLRQLEGTQGDISREETAVHLHARWTVPVGEAVEIALFGGPTFFRASQELLTAVDFSQEYPYDTATLGLATTREYDGSTVGFNVGADIAVYFSKWVGVGGLIRFSRADLDLSDGSTTVTVGGLHTAGGLRLRF